jgi:uncharacterized protein YjbI with pentapeptide repeats
MADQKNSPECFCGEHIPDSCKKEIRRAVCIDSEDRQLDVKYEQNGNYYCILHHPNVDKAREFEDVFQSKLDGRNHENVDFRGIWFPYDLDKHIFRSNQITDTVELDIALSGKALGEIDFFLATFARNIDLHGLSIPYKINFNSAIFNGWANFRDAIFIGDVNFSGAKFQGETYFSGAAFRKDANFSYAHFYSSTSFLNVQFNVSTFFTSVFQKSVKFDEAHFKENNFTFVTFESLATYKDSHFESEARFDDVKFNGETRFRCIFDDKTTFENSVFLKEVSFRKTKFKGSATFRRAKFQENCSFSDTRFNNAADFSHVAFGETSRANFRRIFFHKGADFSYVVVRGYLTFEGRPTNTTVFNSTAGFTLNLRNARLEKADLVLFNNIKIRPSWFVGVDARRLAFADVAWENADGSKIKIENEFNSLKNPYPDLLIACRQLSMNADENGRFEEASKFRKMALETERLERRKRRKIWFNKVSGVFGSLIKCSNFFSESKIAGIQLWDLTKSFPFDILHFLYGVSSGYGENWRRALSLLIGILFFWSLIYSSSVCSFTDNASHDLGFWVGYSLNVVTLQRPEPKPANTFTMIFIGLEILFAPIQAALLILAVRRKFMR